MGNPPRSPLGWSLAHYDGLADALQERKADYLRTLANWPIPPGRPDDATPPIVARMRGYLDDDREGAPKDQFKASARLRKPPDEAWKAALTPEYRAASRPRWGDKPFTTVWSDDPLMRSQDRWPVTEEDVNLTTARLAVLGPSTTFVKPFGAPLHDVERPLPLKLLMLTIFELRIERRDRGDRGSIKDVVLAQAEAAKAQTSADAAQAQAAYKPAAAAAARSADELLALLYGWFAELHLPVKELHQLDEASASIASGVAGYDASAILAAYGIEIAQRIFALRRWSVPSNVMVWIPSASDWLTDLLGWLAQLALTPAKDALAAIADLQTLHGAPVYDLTAGSWRVDYGLTALQAPLPLDPGLPGALFARLLSCRFGESVRFHFDLGIEVPKDWVWPAADADGIYWWAAVLRPNCCEHILKLKDTADFKVTDVLRFGFLHGLFAGMRDDRVPEYVAQSIRVSLLSFKFWIDEPPESGNDGGEMTFWSENHQVQFHAAEFLVGGLFPDDVFVRSGSVEGHPVTGRDHQRRGRERLTRWLDRRLRYGFSEWCSPGYYNEDFPPLFNLIDFAPDDEIVTKATMVVDRLIFDLARLTCRGSFASSAGRCYFEHKGFGWEHSVGETIEVLFGTRGDHIAGENTAIALCTSTGYEVPEVLLAIGLDRVYLDTIEPFWDRSRASITLEEGKAAGIFKESDDDVCFWWGLGAYFTEEMRESTRRVASAHGNLTLTPPMRLLWKLEQTIPGLGDLPASVRSLLLDSAALMVSTNLAAGSGALFAVTPFPINMVFGLIALASVSLTIQSVIHLLGDLINILEDGLNAVVSAITGDDPPPPHIPDSAVQQTFESLLEMFNRGNLLTRANLTTFGIGEAMLSSVQQHRAGEVSFQKLPWVASLGLDACVWTNAPLTASGGGYPTAAGWELFKHALLLQGSDAMVDGAKIFGLADMKDLKKEGLYEWGGSISLPTIVQYRDAAIIGYDFSNEHRSFSSTPTHAWFPTEYFDEVDPSPVDERWLSDGGSWVFGSREDGYVALYSARRIKWVRDHRFDDDPSPADPSRKIRDVGAFTTTELRAEEGSNFWICAIGNARRFGSFAGFVDAIRTAPVSASGIGGSLEPLACSFEMPAAEGDPVGSFRLDVSASYKGANLNGRALQTDEFPRYENAYVAAHRPGVVGWEESVYQIRHPQLGLSLEHDIGRHIRTLGPPQVRNPAKSARSRLRGNALITSIPVPPAGDPATAKVPSEVRRRRFRLANLAQP
ncbi:MAG: hypothetical protein ACOH10_13805 [Rhodoglobus sp.]